jgi:major inositol transporter-like SP family MFS transporter
MALLPAPGGWLWSLAMPLPAGAGMLLALAALPESPRWLATRGVPAEAVLRALQRFRPAGAAVVAEAGAIAAVASAGGELGLRATLGQLAAPGPVRRKFLISWGVCTLMSLTGIDLMVMWSPDLFGRAGFGEAGERSAAVSPTTRTYHSEPQ